ncbi:3-hydroxyacyl-CoA dehydrogenase family protein, partial [Pseudomonas zeae]|uniref:3-hydroxyacyl-CoA dehydrogenase family protein n=1 Tax=Pseudomonas zeae TaxID=2745510 RepID=UPI003D049C73
NEAAKILEEGIAQRGSDIDMAWVNGFAWPASKGGPMYFADEVGLGTVAETLERLHAQHPAIAPPAPLLLQLAHKNARLSEYEALPLR